MKIRKGRTTMYNYVGTVATSLQETLTSTGIPWWLIALAVLLIGAGVVAAGYSLYSAIRKDRAIQHERTEEDAEPFDNGFIAMALSMALVFGGVLSFATPKVIQDLSTEASIVEHVQQHYSPTTEITVEELVYHETDQGSSIVKEAVLEIQEADGDPELVIYSYNPENDTLAVKQ